MKIEFIGTKEAIDKQTRTEKHFERLLKKETLATIIGLILVYVLTKRVSDVVLVFIVCSSTIWLTILEKHQTHSNIELLSDILNTQSAVISKGRTSGIIEVENKIQLMKVIHEDMKNGEVIVNLDKEECTLNSKTYNSIW